MLYQLSYTHHEPSAAEAKLGTTKSVPVFWRNFCRRLKRETQEGMSRGFAEVLTVSAERALAVSESGPGSGTMIADR